MRNEDGGNPLIQSEAGVDKNGVSYPLERVNSAGAFYIEGMRDTFADWYRANIQELGEGRYLQYAAISEGVQRSIERGGSPDQRFTQISRTYRALARDHGAVPTERTMEAMGYSLDFDNHGGVSAVYDRTTGMVYRMHNNRVTTSRIADEGLLMSETEAA